jgi:hypothetical protein
MTNRICLQEAREHAWLKGCSLPPSILEAPLYADPLVQELVSKKVTRRAVINIPATYTPHDGSAATTVPLSTEELRLAGYGRNATFVLNPAVPPSTNQVIGQNNGAGPAPAAPSAQGFLPTPPAAAAHIAPVSAPATATTVLPASPSNSEIVNTTGATMGTNSSGGVSALTATSPSRTSPFITEARAPVPLLQNNQGAGPSSFPNAGQNVDGASHSSVLPRTPPRSPSPDAGRTSNSRTRRCILKPSVMDLDTIMETSDVEVSNVDAGRFSQAAAVPRRSARIKAKAAKTRDDAHDSKRKGGPNCATGTSKKRKTR